MSEALPEFPQGKCLSSSIVDQVQKGLGHIKGEGQSFKPGVIWLDLDLECGLVAMQKMHWVRYQWCHDR